MHHAFLAVATADTTRCFRSVPDLIYGGFVFVVVLVVFIWKVHPATEHDARRPQPMPSRVASSAPRSPRRRQRPRRASTRPHSPRLAPRPRRSATRLAPTERRSSPRRRSRRPSRPLASPRTPSCRSRPSAPPRSSRCAPRSDRSRSTSRPASSARACRATSARKTSSTASLPTSRLRPRRRPSPSKSKQQEVTRHGFGNTRSDHRGQRGAREAGHG